MAQELDYLNQVMCETLRFQAPLLNTSFSELDRDTKVGNFVIKNLAEFSNPIGQKLYDNYQI